MKLGFQLIVEAPMGNGETWLQVGLPSQVTSLSLMNFHSLVLETDDIDKEIAALKAIGLEVSKIDETPWGKFAQIKDPDGNAISLHQK